MRPAAFGSTTRYRIATGSFLSPTSRLENSILPFSLIASCSSEPQLRVSSGDLQATPVARGVPGVEIHSAARTDTARGVFGSARLGGWGRNLVYTAGRVGLTLALPRIGALPSAVLSGASIAIAFGTSWLLFRYARLLIDPVYPWAVMTLVYLVATLLGYLRTEARQRQIRSAFPQYVSPHYVDELAAHP